MGANHFQVYFTSGESAVRRLKSNTNVPEKHHCIRSSFKQQCSWKTFMVHQTFVRWALLYSLFKFVKSLIVARLSKSLATLTLGSSKINQHCWRFHGSGVIAAPQIIGLISFCTGMHHEYFFEVVNVLSCSPFMFENTENKQLDWRIHHSHLASTLFHSLVPWWRPRRIRPQITRLSQLENSAMGTWPIYKNSIIPDWFEKWRDIKFWYRC